jgi:hypothetical protein
MGTDRKTIMLVSPGSSSLPYILPTPQSRFRILFASEFPSCTVLGNRALIWYKNKRLPSCPRKFPLIVQPWHIHLPWKVGKSDLLALSLERFVAKARLRG